MSETKTIDEILRDFSLKLADSLKNNDAATEQAKKELCEALLELGIPLLQNKSGEIGDRLVPASAIKEFFGQEKNDG